MRKNIAIKIFGIVMAALMATSPMYVTAQTPVTASNFDATRYANDYADLKAAFGYNQNSLWSHYVNNGARENRVVYATNGDRGYLAGVSTTATGTVTGVNANNFDATRYANDYADLKAAFGYNKSLLWSHYVNNGVKEGRKAYAVGSAPTAQTQAQAQPVATTMNGLNANNFDANRYANDYADLKAAFGYNKNLLWNHYVNNGAREGRKAYAVGATQNTQVKTMSLQEYYATEEYRTAMAYALAAQQAPRDMSIIPPTATTVYTGEVKDFELVYKILNEILAEKAYDPQGCYIFSEMFYNKALAHGFTADEVGFIEVPGVHRCNKILINGNWYDVDAQSAAHAQDARRGVSLKPL